MHSSASSPSSLSSVRDCRRRLGRRRFDAEPLARASRPVVCSVKRCSTGVGGAICACSYFPYLTTGRRMVQEQNRWPRKNVCNIHLHLFIERPQQRQCLLPCRCVHRKAVLKMPPLSLSEPVPKRLASKLKRPRIGMTCMHNCITLICNIVVSSCLFLRALPPSLGG